jgi:hypothetical protein
MTPWLTHEHFVHDDPHGPVVTDVSVASLHKYLRGDVIRGTDGGVGLYGRGEGKGQMHSWEEGVLHE